MTRRNRVLCLRESHDPIGYGWCFHLLHGDGDDCETECTDHATEDLAEAAAREYARCHNIKIVEVEPA